MGTVIVSHVHVGLALGIVALTVLPIVGHQPVVCPRSWTFPASRLRSRQR